MNSLRDALQFFAFNTEKVFKNVNTSGGKAANYSSLSGVFNEIFVWAGIIAVIVIVVSGLMYITSAGDPGKVSKAKNALTFSIVGLLLVVFASVIVNIILGML